jgi:RND family efflux transporter MFP subunit
MKNFKGRRVAAAAAVVVIIGIVIGVLFSKSSKPQDEKAPAAKPALTVATVQPAQERLPIRLAANGNIEAWQEASIGSESSGLRLADVLVNVGDRVKAGQVLARFDADTVQADVGQARASVLEAEANAAQAIGNAERARKLESSGALSAQEIAQYYTAEQTAKARVAAAKAGLATQELRLKHTVVTAPDSGVISDRKATVGAVAASGAELFRMIRKGRLEWRAEVTSSESGRVNVGTPVTITAADGSQLKGKVRMVAPTVNPDNRNTLVYVDLLAPADKPMAARAGMFARGEFELGATSALTLPLQAVVLRDGFSYVFQLNPEGRVNQAKVQTGRRLGERVEVLGGIKPDAAVVSSGAGFLNDGDLVRVVPATEKAIANQAENQAEKTATQRRQPGTHHTSPAPAKTARP